jgi:hypothetical protein
MKGTGFKAISLIHQTVTRELKVIWEEALSRAFDLSYERYKRCAVVGGDYMSDGINNFFLSFCVDFFGLSLGICHTAYILKPQLRNGLNFQ